MLIFSTQQNWLRMWPLAMMSMSMWRIFLTRSAVPLLQQRRITISFITTASQTLKIWILSAKPPLWNPPQSMYPSARSSQVGLVSGGASVNLCFLQVPLLPAPFLVFPPSPTLETSFSIFHKENGASAKPSLSSRLICVICKISHIFSNTLTITCIYVV